MDDNFNYQVYTDLQKESKIKNSSIPIPINIKTYYINRSPTYHSSTDIDTIESPRALLYAQKIREKEYEDNMDVIALYFCAVLSLIVPYAGIFYLCCFRFCCGNFYPFGPKKMFAYKMIGLATVIGFILEVIGVMLLREYKIDVLN